MVKDIQKKTNGGSSKRRKRIVIMERRAFGNDLSVRLKVLGSRFPDNENSLDELIRNPQNVPLSLITLNENRELVSVELVNSTAADNAIKYFENNEDGLARETFEFPQMNLYSVGIGEIIRSISKDIWDEY
jgi:hypothetical protein